jgi:pimeloyl-ACP methyl ester carboxylesterase
MEESIRAEVWRTLFNLVARFWGVHPVMIPRRYWQVMLTTQLGEERLREVLRDISNLELWPDIWERAGMREEDSGNIAGAGLCYYIAQRLMILPSAQKDRLYQRAASLYRQTYGYGHRMIPVQGGEVATLWQDSERSGALGTIILVPGVTFTKEELHYHALTYSARGYNVVRLDNPVYGETKGLLRAMGLRYPTDVTEAVRESFPGLPVYMHGMSYGGHVTLWNADSVDGWSTLSAPYNARPYYHKLPYHSRQALVAMFGSDKVSKWMSAPPPIHRPGVVLHGARDKTIPLAEAHRIAKHARSYMSVFPREGHSAPHRYSTIAALNLNWFTYGQVPMRVVPDRY